jgi:hypothetical protein
VPAAGTAARASVEDQRFLAGTAGRIAFAEAYVINSSPLPEEAQFIFDSPNDLLAYVGTSGIARGNGGASTAVALLEPFAQNQQVTRIMVKLFQSADDADFQFSMRIVDENGNPFIADEIILSTCFSGTLGI